MSLNLDASKTLFATNRELGLINNKLNKALERLNTGLKINRASDDAANLKLTKSFDSHISDSRAFQENAQNANNLLNIVDGDMEKIQNNLQRLRSLAVQGMNDVYSPSELNAIHNEVMEIAYEIEQITKSSSFSDKKLLDGTTTDLQVQVASGENVDTRNIDLTAITDELDFVDVLTEKEQLYFLNMAPGGTYYAEFDDRIYELTNNSAQNRSLIYRYEEDLGNLDNSIEFIKDSNGVSASLYGEYENDQVQLGNGEMAVEVPASSTTHIRVGNRVFDLTNASGTSNTVVFETPGAAINVLSGDGITGSFEYTTSAYTANSAGQYALDFTGGETKHVEFAGRLYELQNTSGSSETIVFNNSGGLSAVAGGGDINITDMGAMTNETVLSGSEKYVELTAGQTQYYEDGGRIYRLHNNTGQAQSAILNGANNLLNTTGTVSRTEITPVVNGDVSAMANPYAMQVQSGQTYYVKSSDGSTLHELNATQSGVALLDFDGDNIVGFDGANINHNVVTGTSFADITPDGFNQFSVNLAAGATETIAIGDEIYTIDNSGNGAQSVSYQYNSVAKTITDISAFNTVGSYVDNTDNSDMSATGANDVFVQNLGAGATTYLEVGSDIFEVRNTGGAARGFTFSYNAGAHTLTPSTGGSVTANAMDVATVGSVDAGDIMLNLANNETQHITVGGDTFSVENTLGTAQTVLLSYNAGSLNVDSGSALNITAHNDKDAPTALNTSNFYVDLNASETKYISRGGELFSISNTTADSKIAVFSQVGNVLNPVETTNVNTVSMGAETAEYVTTGNDYYTELDANEQKFVNHNGGAFEFNNSTGAPQTEVFSTLGATATTMNANVNAVNIPLSNLDNYNQLLVKVDWAMETLAERRSELGAKMNALSQIVDRNNVRENSLVASNSILLDADIAKESMELAKNQILQQSATAMFSQGKNINKDMTLLLLSSL